jgi:hypothetical protein
MIAKSVLGTGAPIATAFAQAANVQSLLGYPYNNQFICEYYKDNVKIPL